MHAGRSPLPWDLRLGVGGGRVTSTNPDMPALTLKSLLQSVDSFSLPATANARIHLSAFYLTPAEKTCTGRLWAWLLVHRFLAGHVGNPVVGDQDDLFPRSRPLLVFSFLVVVTRFWSPAQTAEKRRHEPYRVCTRMQHGKHTDAGPELVINPQLLKDAIDFCAVLLAKNESARANLGYEPLQTSAAEPFFRLRIGEKPSPRERKAIHPGLHHLYRGYSAAEWGRSSARGITPA